MRWAIVLGVAWLFGLTLVVIATPFEGEPSRRQRAIQRAGSSAVTVAIGFAVILLVALLVNPLFPPSTSVSNSKRIDALEQWKAAHDSLHAKQP